MKRHTAHTAPDSLRSMCQIYEAVFDTDANDTAIMAEDMLSKDRVEDVGLLESKSPDH